MSIAIEVWVRGTNDQVIPALTDFMNSLGDRATMAMSDPEAFTRDGYVADKVQITVHAAANEDEARAITRALIDQVPSAVGILDAS